MAVIPPDAGIRMRMQTEASLVQPLAPVKAVSADLPELQPGQVFTARILETLPDNSYKALIAGRQLTLQLPEGAAPGDSLELVVIDRTPKLLIAQRAEASTAPGGEAALPSYTRISDAGRLIGQLLLPEGETPQPAALTRGEPLLPQPPANAADLAPTLARAVSQSGLFYESHQAQWLSGQRPLESLRAEPQGQLPASAATSPAATGPATAQATAPSAGRGEISAGTQPAANHTNIPDQVRPLVQQQLDAVTTQRLAWHGEVWPDQTMDWSIGRESVDQREAGAEAGEAARWSTTLRLTMPRLGDVGATLQLAGATLRLTMTAGSDNTMADLRQQAPELIRALANAGLALQAFEVHREA